jgi:hypothetical protein
MTDVVYTESDSNVLIESSDGSIDVLITESGSNVVVSEGESLTEITTTTDTVTTIEYISVGPQGPPGTGGGSSDLSIVAAVALGGHRIVVPDENGKAIYADNTILSHANKVLGMTTGAVAESGTATVRIEGEITESSWTWTLDIPVWLSTNGLMTQTPPTTGFSLIIGFPISATKLFIDIREPIFLS